MYDVSNQSSIFLYSREAPEGWTLVAALDESEPYEVDITEIWHDGSKYQLVTASGCSCWDGDYDVTEYESLDALEASLRGEDQPRWNPSLRGVEELMRVARG